MLAARSPSLCSLRSLSALRTQHSRQTLHARPRHSAAPSADVRPRAAPRVATGARRGAAARGTGHARRHLLHPEPLARRRGLGAARGGLRRLGATCAGRPVAPLRCEGPRRAACERDAWCNATSVTEQVGHA
eukprot:2919829-Prymnesium_polylepis.1